MAVRDGRMSVSDILLMLPLSVGSVSTVELLLVKYCLFYIWTCSVSVHCIYIYMCVCVCVCVWVCECKFGVLFCV
jgi:hypothetical protein